MAEAKGKSRGKGKGRDPEARRGKGKGKSKGKAKVERFASDTPGYVWVQKSFRRLSLFATDSLQDNCDLEAFPGDARVEMLRTDSELLGLLECIIVEPRSKKLIPQDFVTTGVIICMHGMPASKSIMEEWGAAIKAAGWMDLSCSVVIPNVQMSAALQLRDFEAIVDAALELANFTRCLLVGKFWGALRAIEIATQGTLGGKVEGLILVAPSSPAPIMCNDLDVPALLVWASDDDVSSFDENSIWKEALDDRCAPTTFLPCDSGGHNFGRMLKDPLAAQAVRNFTAASLLIGELEEAIDDSGAMRPTKSERERKLSNEIPRFLQDAENGKDEEPSVVGMLTSQAKRKSNKAFGLMSWMQAGMQTAAE